MKELLNEQAPGKVHQQAEQNQGFGGLHLLAQFWDVTILTLLWSLHHGVAVAFGAYFMSCSFVIYTAF